MAERKNDERLPSGGASKPPEEAAEAEAEECEVVVIGGGLAGLACAAALRRGGLKVVVVEARDRLGGRVESTQPEGWPIPIELGAQWIHSALPPEPEPEHPVAVLVKAAGLQSRLFSWDDCAVTTEGVVMPAAQVEEASEAAERCLSEAWRLGKLAKKKKHDGSLGKAMEPALVNELKKSDGSLLRLLVKLELDLDYGVGAELLSLSHYNNDDFFGAVETEDANVVGALGEVIDRFEEQARLGHVVDLIEAAHDGVVVSGYHGKRRFSIKARRCVVTLPLGVLKAAMAPKAAIVRFDPPLHASKIAALERMGVSPYNKVALLFDAPFWEEKLGKKPVLCRTNLETDARPRFNCFVSMAAFYGSTGPVLVSIIGGEDALALEALSDAEVKKAALDAVDSMLPGASSRCRGFICSRWLKDPFALGSYSHLPPGATPDDYDTLARPEHRGLVGFAGEHTSRKYPATMHGAILSGEKEAARILQAENNNGNGHSQPTR